MEQPVFKTIAIFIRNWIYTQHFVIKISFFCEKNMNKSEQNTWNSHLISQGTTKCILAHLSL